MTNTRPAQPRRLATLLSLLFIPFLLTGCFKFTMDLEVSSEDTISGTAVVALSKELQALAQGGGEEPTDAFADLDGVEVTTFDDGTFVGQQYEFSGLPIEDWTLDDDSSALTIQRDGDNLIVSGSLSFEDEESDPAAGEDLGFGQAFFDSADLRVSIKFPGQIVETNGEINEETNTITWRPKYGEANELNAVVYAPKGIPIWVWWVVGGVLGTLALAAAFFILLRRRARPTGEVSDGGEPEGGSIAKSAIAKDGFPRTDRPIFSYRVHSSPFSKDVFELRVYDDELSYAFLTKGETAASDLVTIQVAKIDDVARIEDSNALGVRLIHSGRVEILPAKAKDAQALVSLLRALSVKKSVGSHLTDVATHVPGQASPNSDAGELAISVELRQLSKLLADGVISEDEFLVLKKKRIDRE